MPAYLSHAVFSHKVFKSLEKYKLIKIDIPVSKLRFDSIKTDFFAYKSKNFLCYDENHNCYIQEFVKTQMEYIIKNKLYENTDVMSEFYGHILHTIMDQVFHPFIYSMTDNYETKGMPIRGSHFELESLIDSYLVNEYLKKIDVKDYARFCVDPKYIILSQEEKGIINYSYGKVYGYSNLDINSFILTIGLILEELTIRCDNASIKRSFYEKLGFKYLSRNIKSDEYKKEMNLENKNWLLSDLKVSNSSIDDLYRIALNRSLEVIEVLNQNIYDKRKVDDSFYKVFEDISLDTGVKCSYQKRK